VRQYTNFEYDYSLIEQEPVTDLGMSVVIPVHDEADLNITLESLLSADLLDEIAIEVILVVNDAEDTASRIKLQNDKTFSEINRFAKEINEPALRFFCCQNQRC